MNHAKTCNSVHYFHKSNSQGRSLASPDLVSLLLLLLNSNDLPISFSTVSIRSVPNVTTTLLNKSVDLFRDFTKMMFQQFWFSLLNPYRSKFASIFSRPGVQMVCIHLGIIPKMTIISTLGK